LRLGHKKPRACDFAHSKAAARLLGIEVCTGKTKTS